MESFSQHEEFDYNLLVLGGGSAGLAVAKEAAILGQRVLLLDVIPISKEATPSSVSCSRVVLKRLLQQGALLGRNIKDSPAYGWKLPPQVPHNWDELTDALRQRVKALSFEQRVELRKSNITHLYAKAKLLDPHTIQATDANGDVSRQTAETIVIATGEQPLYLDTPGAKEHCINCDDLFFLSYCPGRTLVVGCTAEALEAAGWLLGLGLDVSIMTPPSMSSVLENYDRKMLKKIEDHMYVQGVNILHGHVLSKVEQIKAGCPGHLQVTAHSSEDGEVYSGEFNTVLLANGRDGTARDLGLVEVGVGVNQRTGKIVVNEEDQTSVSNIYALGSVQDGRFAHPGLSLKAGHLLAHRLYAGKSAKCDYTSVPVVLFTSIEYAACGLTEEAANRRFGESDIEVFHSYFWPQEWTLPLRSKNSGYAKVICHISDELRVLGIHVLGPNAGDIIQGFSVALKFGLTKDQLDAAIGLHPLCAEVLTNLTTTQRQTDAMRVQGNC